MKYLYTISSFLLWFQGFALGQTTNKVIFNFEHKVGNESLLLDSTVFPVWNNKNMKVTRAQFYLSEMELKLAGGSVQPLTDHYLLISANEKAVDYDMGNWPISTISGATLHVGVPKEVNHDDPSLWPPRHPLTLQDPSMHWGWAGGYRFLAIEGKVDNDNDGVPETPFEYHCLGDNLYKSVDISGISQAQNGILRVKFILDYARLFNDLNLKKDLIQHGNGLQNGIMMNNASVAGFITMSSVSSVSKIDDSSMIINVLPNPSDDRTMIQYAFANGNKPLDLLIYNANGQLIHTEKGLTPIGTTNLLTSSFPNGLYQCSFWENGHFVGCKPLVVKH